MVETRPLRKDLFAFLRAIGLTPLEWHKGIEATEVRSPSIRQILDAMFEQAAAVVVLLTPDDTHRLKPEFQSRTDPTYETKFVGQARPNVLFEAGMAFGSHPGSVVLVQVGSVKPFTDVGGVHVTYLNNSPEKRSELATKLRAVGCYVDQAGATGTRPATSRSTMRKVPRERRSDRGAHPGDGGRDDPGPPRSLLHAGRDEGRDAGSEVLAARARRVLAAGDCRNAHDQPTGSQPKHLRRAAEGEEEVGQEGLGLSPAALGRQPRATRT